MATRIILDTDIGTDVDDCLALAVILGSPELQLEAITCVYGDVELRTRMVRKLLRLRGRDDIPVYNGVRLPMLGIQPVYWPGHEGVGLLDDADAELVAREEHAVDYIVRTVMENPGQIHLVGIGPLTNLALAFQREPRLAQNLAHLTLMAGCFRSASRFNLPYSEHNVRCDPEAAHVVFTSGAPMTVVPLDVTLLTHITRPGVARVRASGTPFHDAIATQVEVYPYFAAQGFTYAHDPLAIAAIIQPDLMTYTDLHVDVELGGRHSVAATLAKQPGPNAPMNARVALTVDTARAEEFLIERMAN